MFVDSFRKSQIDGGFLLVPAASILHAWHTVSSGDFRAWLACWEIKARRQRLQDGRAAAYSADELARLAGISVRTARISIRRLIAAEILFWNGDAIEFPEPAAPVADLDDTIGRGKGSLVVPRRILRHLAHRARPATIAATLGILFRCLSRRRSGFDGRGRVKASWIARLFRIDLRRVKAARAELVTLGWLHPEPDDQRLENRHGRAYRIDLAWEPDPSSGRRLPPPHPLPRLPIATPSEDPDPLREEIRHQEPVSTDARTGVRLPEVKGEPTPLPAPKLDDVRPEDLRETGRLLELHGQAVVRQLIGPSESDRLRFMALAEHARVVGRSNPPGLFAALLRRGAWSFITQAEEDAARRRLKGHLHGPSSSVVKDPAPRRVSSFVADRPAAAPSSLGQVLSGIVGRLTRIDPEPPRSSVPTSPWAGLKPLGRPWP